MRQSDAREVPLVERRRESVRLEFTFEGIFFIIQRISLLNPKFSSFYHQAKERVCRFYIFGSLRILIVSNDGMVGKQSLHKGN